MRAIQSSSTATLDKTSWEILNSLADDCENLEEIYRGVCYEVVSEAKGIEYRAVADAPFLWEVIEHLRELFDRNLIAPVMDENGQPWNRSGDGSVLWKAWFAMTPAGKAEWEHSEFFSTNT